MSDEADRLFAKAEAEESRNRAHPEDEAHLSSEEEEDEDAIFERLEQEAIEKQFQPNNDLDKMPYFKSSTALAKAGNFNTGVKGVISDAVSFQSAKRREIKSRERQNNHTRTRSIPQSPNDSEDLDIDESELMTQWRKARLAELKSASTKTRRQSPSKRNYGRVEPVDAVGYLDAIEKVSKDTIVVVVVYQDQSYESNFVLDCLITIAMRYPTTRFVKLHHLEAEMDQEVTPAVLAYKGGELFQTVMRIVDEIPTGRSLSTESLELVLQKQNILNKEELSR